MRSNHRKFLQANTAVVVRLWALTAMLLMVASVPLHSAPVPVAQWTATWGSAQLKPSGADALPPQVFEGATLRQVVHISIGGVRLRLHLSNAFGATALVLRSVELGRGRAGRAALVEQESPTAVHFDGAASVTIPAGAEYFSDPIAMIAPPLSDVVVTMLIEKAPETLTFHAGSRATSYLLRGDHVAELKFEPSRTFEHWYFLAGIEAQGAASTVVTLGDSITDGHGTTTDGNDRWTDVLARRLAASGIGVVNQGIGGNRILEDGLGPNALARFDRDVLGTAGVRSLIVLEGINDLGGLDRVATHPQEAHDALVAQLEGALRQMVERAHTHGIRVCGGTLTPYRGSGYYHPSEASEADRQQLNRWIRTSGVFDDIIDFDALVRDPAHPEQLAPEADSGDHLHPNPEGYRRMGEGVPLVLLVQ